MSGNWLRYRFVVKSDDYRTTNWPPPGPFWCSGYDPDDNPVVIAYVQDADAIKREWPDADQIESATAHDAPAFSDRFPCPDWWDAEKQRFRA